MKLLLFEYNYFPYEKKFLDKEIIRLGGKIRRFNNKEIEVDGISLKNAKALTYVKYIINDGKTFETEQCIRECINGKLQNSSQSTRYGPHGLHDYKGKFNPQTPRSLLLQNFKSGDKILDPFMGSGTTLIEAANLGIESYGIELNPFAFEITKSKLLFEKLNRLPKLDISKTARKNFQPEIEEYLLKWFTHEQFKDLTHILGLIESSTELGKEILKMILSDQIRKNSLQDPRDLRIRRRKTAPLRSTLLEDFTNRYKHIIDVHQKWASLNKKQEKIPKIFLGDSTAVNNYIKTKIDGTVCSPPYFSALPYVDTYRLSMVALELIDPKSIASEERKLIGARDINEKEKKEQIELLKLLPISIKKVIRNINNLLEKDKSAGFRKKAVPFNLIRYCGLIQTVLKSLIIVEKMGALNLWVVGPNRVNIGGKNIIIDTPKIISDLAKNAGFKNVNLEFIEAYSRYDLHSKNSIKREVVVKFSK